MHKIRNKEEFEKLIFANKIPPIIANQIYGDLLMFGEFLLEEYEGTVKSSIVLVEKDEFEKVAEEFQLELNEYEYDDVIAVTNDYYIEKLLYIKDNGNIGIIVYKIHKFGSTLEKFNNDMYCTRGVHEHIPPQIVIMLKSIIESTRVKMLGNLDYLQIFNIENVGNKVLKISHLQEKPEHSQVYYIEDVECKNCKLYWISDEVDGKEYSTLLLAEEY